MHSPLIFHAGLIGKVLLNSNEIRFDMGTIGDFFERKNLVFYWTSAVLLVALVLYPLFGGVLMSVVFSTTGSGGAISEFAAQDLPVIRMVQVVGQVLVLGLPVLFLAKMHTGVKRIFSRGNLAFLGFSGRVSAKGLLLALAGVLLLQPFIYALIEAIGALLPYLGKFGEDLLQSQEQLEEFLIFLAGADSMSEFIAVAFVIAFVPAICEEVFFRGYIQRNYIYSLSPAAGVLLTGFVFGLFHMSPASLLPLTIMGWYLGYVYYKTQNLFVPVAVHFCNNFLSLVLLQLQRNKTDITGETVITAQTIGWVVFAVAVSLVLFLVVMRNLNRLYSVKSG